MENENILSGGIDVLMKAKEYIKELDECKNDNVLLKADEKKLDKELKALEKEIIDTTSSTIKKRKKEIEDTYDVQLNKERSRIKKIENKREKDKHLKMSKRIKNETSSLREENRQISLQAKSIFKSYKVPSLCNTKVFYGLFSPKGLEGFLVIALSILITLLVIPVGIYYLIIPGDSPKYLIAIYVISVLFFGALYVAINHYVKNKHIDAIGQVKILREEIRLNKRKIALIKRKIVKDKDESSYELEGFDEELAKYLQAEAELVKDKKNAVLAFEDRDRKIITDDIKSQYEDRLSQLKENYHRVYEDVKLMEERIKNLTVILSTEYESLIGKDFLSLERLEELITIINEGKAVNVSEAIRLYQQNIDKG